MNLKKLFMFLFILNTVSFIFVAVMVNKYQKATLELENAYQMQYNSLLLAQELRQSSDDLTRMARTYVITGNDMFKKQFKTVLDIRNGVLPRPKRYKGIFWDFYTLEDIEPLLDGEKVSLRELMKRANFSKKELDLLIQSQKESDSLTSLEHKAMNAIKGIFQDEKGEYTIKEKPDFKLARELMHSDRYHEAKIRIMQPLDKFYKAFESRTKAEVDKSRLEVKELEFSVNVIVLFSIIIFLLSSFIVLFRIVYPIDLLRILMLKLSSNDMDVELDKSKYQDEVADMIGAVKVFKDNTQKLIASESELKRAIGNAQSANKAKSIFLARMSHELRTPLNAILGFSNLLSKSKNINSNEKDNLQTIRKSANYLLNIINEILELSKIEAGKIEIVPKAIDFYETIKEIEALFLFRSKAKGLKFNIKYDDNLPKYITLDEQRLKQILINLLSNALKFTKKGEINLYIYESMNKLFFEVSDMGIGIKQEDLKKIFKPFEQIKQEDYNKNGTGLGLSITSELVSLMGGTIYAKSQEGVGSKFYFSVDYKNTTKDLIKIIKDKNLIVGIKNKEFTKTVLVVDDIIENRKLLVELLHYYGIKTYEARDGLEALDIYKKENIDLIFMDILMPKLDGIEVIKRIRIKDNKIPIVVVSANVFNEDKKNAFDNGANDFMTKPIEEGELLLMLEKHIDANLKYEENNEESKQLDYKSISKENLEKLIEACKNMDNKVILELLNKEQLSKELTEDIKTRIDEFRYHEIIELCKDSKNI
ncbi:response regulator [Poseidonibacter ostreae]|uniref:histidine kinase n=1 Tax=Poseidonibacter ostreae TaxID=2654171 RepID=A0A6L4WSE8_9BACT|nr:response regulator [Poseidonibacter ostreae]KAB7884429.1 response regulator [Poseidonibacter ostreae]KAB7888785.1 response regulator [Poseidonibacter ostreae]KAB7891182.1 response regulator [Poseidonibacter ostreae]MAC84866.1 hybrid sensor histidine kinase/response regulator [Arcobacter sp.]